MSNKLVDKPQYAGRITKLQAAIKYSQEDVLSAKKLVDSCPSDDPDKEVNLGCLLYKVLEPFRGEGNDSFKLIC